MAGTVAIGIQQFNEIRKKGYFYIDKTAFIREWWEEQDVVTLIKYEKDTKLVVNHLVSFFAL